MKFMLHVLLLAIPFVHGLTNQEIALFKSRTHIERNTKTQGWVNVTNLGNGFLKFESNGVPDHDTGKFPADINPNEVTVQSFKFTITNTPTKAAKIGMLPGTVGMAINGVAIFSPYTDQLCDAVTGEYKETFDLCDGHPSPDGEYHYHGKPNCLFTDLTKWSEADQLVGVALDGYPIYGPVDSENKTVTTADLDECHGRTDKDGQYRYRFTTTFPYYLGCLSGEVNTTVALGKPPFPFMLAYATNVDNPNKYCKKVPNGAVSAKFGLTALLVSAIAIVGSKLFV